MRRSINALTGLIAATLALACSSTKIPLPPPVVGSAVDSPVSCKDLQAGQVVGKEIHLDGGVPNCGSTGLQCPLPDLSQTDRSQVCGARSVIAECEQNQWKLVCGTAVVASTADAGDAAQPDAEADAAQD